jgi:hypothetical protein
MALTRMNRVWGCCSSLFILLLGAAALGQSGRSHLALRTAGLRPLPVVRGARSNGRAGGLRRRCGFATPIDLCDRRGTGRCRISAVLHRLAHAGLKPVERSRVGCRQGAGSIRPALRPPVESEYAIQSHQGNRPDPAHGQARRLRLPNVREPFLSAARRHPSRRFPSSCSRISARPGAGASYLMVVDHAHSLAPRTSAQPARGKDGREDAGLQSAAVIVLCRAAGSPCGAGILPHGR